MLSPSDPMLLEITEGILLLAVVAPIFSIAVEPGFERAILSCVSRKEFEADEPEVEDEEKGSSAPPAADAGEEEASQDKEEGSNVGFEENKERRGSAGGDINIFVRSKTKRERAHGSMPTGQSRYIRRAVSSGQFFHEGTESFKKKVKDNPDLLAMPGWADESDPMKV